MKSPAWIRAVALISAAATTYLQFESVALLAAPPSDAAAQIAQIARSMARH
jgi:hypothetical protein